jgi:hypothetical protein
MLYAAKCYWPEITQNELQDVGLRAASGAETSRSRGNEIAYLGSIMFPADDLVLFLFEASSPAAVQHKSDLAGIPCERVMPAVWLAPSRVAIGP